MRFVLCLMLVSSLALAEDAAPPKSDPAAEELLGKVEARIKAAKTVRIRASLAVRLGRFPVNREIELDFKEGNRARLYLSGSNVSEGAACNGKDVRVKLGPEVTTAAAAADFADMARSMTLRLPVDELRGHFVGSPRSAPGYSEFAFLPDEKIGDRAVRVVTFVSTRDDVRQVFRMWIDEKALEVLKREYVEKFGDTETRETLTVSSMSFDADIPDSAFGSVEPKAADDPPPAKSDPAAEDLVKKLEAKVASAKTLSMRGTMVVAAGDEKQSFDIEMDFKEGNRARMRVDGKGSDGKTAFTLTVVCDGKRVARGDPDGTEIDDAEPDIARKARDLAVRAPIRDLTQTLGGKAPKKPLAYTEFALAADEKLGDRTARVVTYAASRGSVRLEMKLWIDAEKLELLKRETLEKKKGAETRVTDTFSAMTCDGEIADDVFTLPEAKDGDKKEAK